MKETPRLPDNLVEAVVPPMQRIRRAAPLTLLFGTSEDAVPEASELTTTGTNGMGTFSEHEGTRHHLIARLASEGDITSVVYSDDKTARNQIGAFTKYTETVEKDGGSFAVWVSNQPQDPSGALAVGVR